MLRECTRDSELIELYIDIQMIVNGLPEFAEEIDPVFNIAVENAPITVPLPPVIDK